MHLRWSRTKPYCMVERERSGGTIANEALGSAGWAYLPSVRALSVHKSSASIVPRVTE